jgi:hypothetical protein
MRPCDRAAGMSHAAAREIRGRTSRGNRAGRGSHNPTPEGPTVNRAGRDRAGRGSHDPAPEGPTVNRAGRDRAGRGSHDPAPEARAWIALGAGLMTPPAAGPKVSLRFPRCSHRWALAEMQTRGLACSVTVQNARAAPDPLPLRQPRL